MSEIAPCLRVREAVEGSGSYPGPLRQFRNPADYNFTIGGKCGSTAIDRAFVKWLNGIVTQDTKGRPLRMGPGSSVMASFEAAKRGFGTSEHSQRWLIPLGNVDDDEINGVEDGEIKLTRYESDWPHLLPFEILPLIISAKQWPSFSIPSST